MDNRPRRASIFGILHRPFRHVAQEPVEAARLDRLDYAYLLGGLGGAPRGGRRSGPRPGADIEATVQAGKTANGGQPGTGLMINSSRAILYAGKDENYAVAARQVALETRDAINRYR